MLSSRLFRTEEGEGAHEEKIVPSSKKVGENNDVLEEILQFLSTRIDKMPINSF